MQALACGNKQNIFTSGRVECPIQLTAPRVDSPWRGRAVMRVLRTARTAIQNSDVHGQRSCRQRQQCSLTRDPKQGGREGATGSSEFAAPDKKPKLNWKVVLSPAPQTAFGFHSPVFSGDGSIYFGSPTGHVWGYSPSGVLMVVCDVKAKIEGKLSVCFLPSCFHLDSSVLGRLMRRFFSV